MQTNETKLIIWSITALLLAMVATEISVYYDPLQFSPFVTKQVFKIGTGIRILFVVLYVSSFLLPDTSLRAEYARKQKKNWLDLTPKLQALVIGVFALGCLLLFTATKNDYSYVFETLALLLILPAAPVVMRSIRQDRTEVFKTDKKVIETPYSFNFQGQNGTWVNIPNPFRGILCVGSNGSGKSASVAEQIIAQGAHKNYSGIIYDYKFPTLTNYAYKHYSRGDCQVDLVIANFVDLERSHRLNPLLPELIRFQAYAYEFATSFYCTLNRDAIRKKDFWDTSAISILAGVIWYMKNHYPQYCTVPHIINMILGHDVYRVIGLLETNYETKTMVASVSTAIKTKAEPQLAGQYGSLQNVLGKINTRENAWVLTGDDFDINLNDPEKPKMLCIGTLPAIVEALAPVVSLIITAALKQMNEQDKHHSMVMLDEGPQCYIPNLSDLPATARSNKVATIYMAQDISQMIKAYGKEEAYAIISNMNYQLFGKNPNVETGEYVSKVFGKEDRLQRNENMNRSNPNAVSFDGKGGSGSQSQGESYSLQEKSLIKPHEVNRLETGEFVGILAETVEPIFRTRLNLPTYSFPDNAPSAAPAFYSDVDVDSNFERIRLECEAIIAGNIAPKNPHLIIKRP